jgi:hypothetical protein
MNRASSRHGSAFLIAMAVVTVMVVLAYGLLAVARNSYTGARATNLNALAQLAARLGSAHANAVINRDFLVPSSSPSTAPAVPSTLNSAWRTSFLPIDTYRTGKSTATTTDDRPAGEENTPEDLNENDVKVENLLTELYCGLGNSSHAGYDGRITIFRGGRLNHPGGGRYIEPGFYNSDLVGKPVSFHLVRDPAALAADPSTATVAKTVGDPDPAAARGEAWGVDVNEPMWLDGDLHAVATRAEARYRLRYAVAIEDLSGHLLMTPPGDWNSIAAIDTGHVVTELEAQQTAEFDPAVGNRHADAFANMAYCTRYYNEGYYGQSPWWAWLSMSGWGAVPLYDGSDSIYRVLRNFSAGPKMADLDSATQRISALAGADRTLIHANRGPAMSFESAQNATIDSDGGRRTAYINTPFGMAGRVAAAPAAWNEAYTDTPWRVNLPTAVPAALRKMLYAYLPAEFHTMRVNWGKYQYVAPGKETKLDGGWIAHENPHIDLFSNSGSHAAFFAHLGAVPYPGTDPLGDISAGRTWQPDLGGAINVNDLGVTNPSTDPLANAWDVPSVIWGQDTSYLEYIRYNNTSKFSTKSKLGDTRNQYLMDDDATRTLSGESDNVWWFWYRHSYWLDLASAFAHTMAATQYAWMGQTGAEYESADPATDPPSGKAAWPATWDDGDPVVNALAGTTCLNTDRDGDGRPDSPSYLATVEQADRQFLKNLGEWPGFAGAGSAIITVDYPTGSRPTATAVGLVSYRRSHANQLEPAELRKFQANANIKSLLAAGTVTADQAALMELVLNDMRMSFFGSSPQYPDFTPLDFDDDGTVHCSCYPGTGTAAADAATGRGPVPLASQRFSLTGYFVIQKSRYYRIFTRGEVYDCLRQAPVASADLETVYHVDPDGEIFDLYDRRLPGALKPLRTETLFQRWLRNRYGGAIRRGE